MKELSIEEKAKAYDEAIEYGRYLINERCKEGTNGSFHRADLQKMFPELKESEDERIRKAIIEHFAGSHSSMYPYRGFTKKQFLDWLEKQGEQKSSIKLERDENGEPILTPFEAELFSMMSDAWQNYSLGEEVNIAKIVKEHSEELLERANEQKPADVRTTGYWHVEDVEQKPADKVEPKFKVGDYIERKDGLGCHVKIIFVGGNVYGCEKLIYPKDSSPFFELMFKNQDEFRVSFDFKQKPADADLKDIVDKEANAIWKEINTGGSHSIIDSFNQFYGIEAVVDCEKPTEWIQELESKLSNATPEQLAEWKEKYFKVEPVLSEDDETVLDNLIYALANDRIGNDRDEYISWLNSLKDRVLPQPKPAWSEEDEKILNSLISSLARISASTRTDSTSVNYTFSKEIDWLKSIRHQNTWKPSEEQMTQLKRYCPDNRPLTSLYEQLKKLKG